MGITKQVSYRRGEDLHFVGHAQTLRIYHLRVNCDPNPIVAYISYVHTPSPSSEIPASFRLRCVRHSVADSGRRVGRAWVRVPKCDILHLGALPKRDSSRLGSPSSLATLAVRLPMTFPTIVSSQNTQTGERGRSPYRREAAGIATVFRPHPSRRQFLSQVASFVPGFRPLPDERIAATPLPSCRPACLSGNRASALLPLQTAFNRIRTVSNERAWLEERGIP